MCYRLVTHPVYSMLQGHNRICQEHAWSNGLHDGLDFFAHGRFVAVYPALTAGGFTLLEGAAGKTPAGIIQQLSALTA